MARLVPQISFMKNKRKWQGTVQGANGVFNDRLSDGDLKLIEASMSAYRGQLRLDRRVDEGGPPLVVMRIFQAQLERAMEDLLDELGLERVHLPQAEESALGGPGSGLTLLTRDRRSDAAVILAVDGGDREVLLRVLCQISALRQRLNRGAVVRGLILTPHVRDELRLAVSEIPTVDVRTYRMRLELDPEPDRQSGNNGWHVA